MQCCVFHSLRYLFLLSSYFSSKENKGKASAGVEPTTFRLLGERTANYAKRPYLLHISPPFLFSPFSSFFLILFFCTFFSFVIVHALFYLYIHPRLVLFLFSSLRLSPRLLCLALPAFLPFSFLHLDNVLHCFSL